MRRVMREDACISSKAVARNPVPTLVVSILHAVESSHSYTDGMVYLLADMVAKVVTEPAVGPQALAS